MIRDIALSPPFDDEPFIKVFRDLDAAESTAMGLDSDDQDMIRDSLDSARDNLNRIEMDIEICNKDVQQAADALDWYENVLDQFACAMNVRAIKVKNYSEISDWCYSHFEQVIMCESGHNSGIVFLTKDQEVQFRLRWHDSMV